MVKASTKSLILASIVIIINFVTYISFRFVGFSELNLIEGLIFTLYESVVHVAVIVPVSFLFFKIKNGK